MMKARLLHKALVFAFLLASVIVGTASPAVEGGVLNIGCYSHIDVIRLTGQWRFYWLRLLTPEQIRKDTSLDYKLVHVPMSWTYYKIDGKNLPNEGYATYYIKIILPHKGLYSIKLYDIFSSYNLYINDSLYASVGKVGRGPNNYKPNKETKIVTFYATSDTLDLVIQVSNYDHRKAGITTAPQLGNSDKIFSVSMLHIIFNFILLGGLLIFSVFHFWLFSYRKYYETLFFALATLFAGLYTLFDRELIIRQIFPHIGWGAIFKGDYLTNYSRVLFLGLYFYSLVKSYISNLTKIIAKTALGFIGLMIVLVIFTPVRIYSFTMPYFIVSTAVIYIFGLFGYIQKVTKEHETLILIPLTGFILLGLTMLNDLLTEFNIIESLELSSLGIFIFVSTQSVILAQRHSNLYRTARKLSQHFEKLDTIKRRLLQISFTDYKYLLLTLKKYFEADIISIIDVQQKQYKIIAAIEHSKYYNEQNPHTEDLLSQILPEFLELTLSIDEPLVISDQNKLLNYIKSKSGLKTKSLMLVRLGTKDNPLGILYMVKEKDYFTAEQKRILQLITTQISTIISNIRLFNNLNDINKNLSAIVRQRTAKIEERNQELEMSTIDLDEKIEELRVTAEIINEMNKDLMEQKEIVEKKNALLKEQTELLKEQKAIVDELNRQITDSVNYARRIQFALLFSENNLPTCTHFIIFKPKEIISGDFWWFKNLEKVNVLIFGNTNLYGVAGAFMSILSYSILNEIITQFIKLSHFKITADVIVREFKNTLSRLELGKVQNIRLGAIVFDKIHRKGYVATDGDNVYLIKNSQVISLKEHLDEFSEIKLEKDNEIVLFTDGFVRELIKLNHILNASEVKNVLSNMKNLKFEDQKIYVQNLLVTTSEQTDDILFIAIKF